MSKSSLVKTVAPEKNVDATAPQHNLSDFKISIILRIVLSSCHFTGLAECSVCAVIKYSSMLSVIKLLLFNVA